MSRMMSYTCEHIGLLVPPTIYMSCTEHKTYWVAPPKSAACAGFVFLGEPLSENESETTFVDLLSPSPTHSPTEHEQSWIVSPLFACFAIISRYPDISTTNETNRTMDVNTLDSATAKLVLELRISEIAEALNDVSLEADQASSFKAVQDALRNQLLGMGGEVRLYH